MAKAVILVVDDEPDIRELVAEILQDEGYQVHLAENGEQARAMAEQVQPDLVLLDVWMPDVDGISVLRQWSEADAMPFQVVMISGHGTIETAVEATRLGAWDFIEKPVSLAKLLITVERALESGRLNRENQHLRHALHYQADMVGQSQAIAELHRQVEQLSPHDPWVLITGEAGTGKETLARRIHSLSSRRDGPFVVLSTGLLNEDNLLQELFGQEKGGRVIPGKLEQAQGGTLYLDELADLSEAAQRTLHSTLESGHFTRVGGERPQRLDVRLISASQQDLQACMREGRLRKALFYQLNVYPLHIPPLRERPEDIPDLIHHFTDLLSSRDGLPWRRFSIAAQNRMRQHGWPGNARELKNLVQRLLMSGHQGEVSLEEVDALLQQSPAAVPESGMTETHIPLDLPLKKARELFEREYLIEQLKRVDGSVGKLASIAGMERTHLYRKLKALDIDPRNL